MPGFFVSNIGSVRLENANCSRCKEDSLFASGFFCARNTLDAFMDDKAFFENEKYIVLSEGVLLNKAELIAEGLSTDIGELIISCYEEHGEQFFAVFRGPFSGALYDKVEKKWVFYVNHCGDSALFYSLLPGAKFVFASQVSYILDLLRSESYPISVDEHAAYAMLTYAFMIDDSTYAKEIKRLLPGYYAVIENSGQVRVEQYYQPKRNKIEFNFDDEEAVIDEIDRLFRQAVRREFDKDLEYGYTHFADLSGGLDSRMTTWVAHELGYGPILNLTYCQSGYLDEKIAEEIAEELGHDLLFKPLDSARFMFDAQRLVEMNFGLSLYSGITGGESLLRMLDLRDFGVEHTGQEGGAIIGTYITNQDNIDVIDHAGMYSNKLLSRLEKPTAADYVDREQYMFCTRGLLGTLGTHFIRRNYCEVTSPFLDVDYLNFCLSIPVEKRIGRQLYKKWINARYPKAASYIAEKDGVPPSAGSFAHLFMRAKRKVRSITKRLGISSDAAQRFEMNPFDYWYKNNESLRTWMNIQADFSGLSVSEELENDMRELFDKGTTTEKTQVLTVLYALRFYASESYTE